MFAVFNMVMNFIEISDSLSLSCSVDTNASV